MAITYTWKISHFNIAQLESKKDAIVEIYWRVIGTDEDGNTASYEGETRFDPSIIEQASADFSDFSKLKEKTVLKWIQNSVNQNKMTVIDETITNKIQRQKYKMKLVEVPWENKG